MNNKPIYVVEKGAELLYYGHSETQARKHKGIFSKLLMFKHNGAWIESPKLEHKNLYAEVLKSEN